MLVGMFWGAPLVAREIEHGTHRLVWTQGVSRLRWATTKIGLISIAVLVITAIYAGMLTWWITPVIQTSGQRFNYIFFDIHGIVVFGYVVFALALGVFAGAVTGRLLPAMATTVVGFIGVRLARDAGGPRSLHGDRDTPPPESRHRVLADAQRPQRRLDRRQPRRQPAPRCSRSTPPDQFWAFQAIETAIFVALAIALLIGSIYWVRRRIT